VIGAGAIVAAPPVGVGAIVAAPPVGAGESEIAAVATVVGGAAAAAAASSARARPAPSIVVIARAIDIAAAGRTPENTGSRLPNIVGWLVVTEGILSLEGWK
jgi:hypothetical protein